MVVHTQAQSFSISSASQTADGNTDRREDEQRFAAADLNNVVVQQQQQLSLMIQL